MLKHLIRLALLLVLCTATPTYSVPVTTTPLNPTELKAVIAEIDAMVKTDERAVGAFIVREATPERIERLYGMPELLTLDTTRRENGLIFAGHSALLRFGKPSDILHKVTAWFPREMATARASGNNSFFGHIDLWGPYPSWGDEQIAFLTLWNCLPQIAWMNPAENPFMRRLNDGLPFLAIAAKSSGELDFGFCVRERSGLRPAWNEQDIPLVKQEVQNMGARATPVLRRKLADFLHANRCQGSGPDDCVLNLYLWASLAPDDPALAAALQTLETEVAPDGPLPELQRPAEQYEAGAQNGEARFDAGLRKAAFLRAKLLSLLHAPDAWPAQSLATAIAQLTQLQQRLDAALDYRWSYYALDYYNEAINPWSVFALDKARKPAMQQVLLAELNTLAADTPCPVYEHWFKHYGAALPTAYALQRMQAQQSPRCASPDWAWLKQGETAPALDMRAAYLALPGHLESGALQDVLLSGLTDNGAACFAADATAATATAAWLKTLCATWISEPQTVQTQLAHSRLSLDDAAKFHAQTLPVPEVITHQADGSAQAAWINDIIPNASGTIKAQLQSLSAELQQRNATIYAATEWKHPDYDARLVELNLNMPDQSSTASAWPFGSSRVLLVIAPDAVVPAGIPQRFDYQYDNGELKHVSDLDGDGRLEVWLSGTFGECDDASLQAGVDCAIETL